MKLQKTKAPLSLPILIFVLFALSGPASADERAAKALNARGYELYKQKKYEEALELFQKSVEADETYGQAHYNIACTLCVLRKLKMICEHDAYRGDIICHLQLTLKYMPTKKAKMLADSDLTPVHDTFGWQMLKGLSPDDPAHLAAILTNVRWYGPAPGVYGPMSGIEFKADGSFRHWRLNIDTDSPRKQYSSGKYSVGKGKIKLIFDRKPEKTNGKREFTGHLSRSGVLQIEELESFTDDPDECSA